MAVESTFEDVQFSDVKKKQGRLRIQEDSDFYMRIFGYNCPDCGIPVQSNCNEFSHIQRITRYTGPSYKMKHRRCTHLKHTASLSLLEIGVRNVVVSLRMSFFTRS